MSNSKVYERITNVIIEKLEQGIVPWHRPWNAECGMPKNMVSGREYRGINIFLLSSLGYARPHFLTFNQVKKLGGNVRKGEKACPVVFWKWLEVDADDEDGAVEVRQIPLLRTYNVFHVSQCDDIPIDKIPELEIPKREFSVIHKASKIIREMPNPPEIQHDYNRAFYSPSNDMVGMPERELFNSDENYYSTMFHELSHSVGAKCRLNRKGATEPAHFGSHSYSQEELVAEMGAAFLCARAGIEERTVDASVAYIGNWLKRLKNDPKLIVIAAAQAQKATDYILNRQDKPKA